MSSEKRHPFCLGLNVIILKDMGKPYHNKTQWNLNHLQNSWDVLWKPAYDMYGGDWEKADLPL